MTGALSEGARGAGDREERHPDPAPDRAGIGIARRHSLTNRRTLLARVPWATEKAGDELHPVELFRGELGQAVDAERVRASVLDPADPVADSHGAKLGLQGGRLAAKDQLRGLDLLLPVPLE